MLPMSDKDDFLATARKRFAAAAEDEKHLRDKFVSDLKFASPDGDDQWDPQVKQQREMAGRPAMSFPRCHTFVQQVSNEARQKKPQIKFAPRLEQDKDTAECLEGLARYIQYDSQAQVAYETAIEYSAGGSFGYYRFLTDYCDDDSDDLELKVVPVLDPLTIYGVLVPACFNRKVRYAFVVEDIPKEEYKAQYGDSEMASLSWAEAERASDGWVGSETVRIAEYWTVEDQPQKGKRRPKSVVKFCKTNGLEVLADSETEWPGSTIPIIAVLGKQMIMEGKPRLFSVVRPQKAAQQLINYSKSRIAETLSTAPISPFMVAEGQISGYEDQWKSLNTSMRPFLTYKMVDNGGRPVPPPARQTFEPPIQALSAFVAQEVDDMKATTGIFDASLGNQANETSGKAILARKDQSNLTTMHYIDNLGRSFKQAGDVIAEVVPLIYDTEREIEILGEDEKQKVVTINKQYTDESGKPLHYKVKGAKMSYVVTMGQAFDSKRSESFDTMQNVLQSAPELLNVIGDLFFKQSDLAGADQIAERLHKMLPPQLQDQDSPLPPQAQAAVAQAQQQAQMMQGEMQKLQFERAAKVAEHQGKMQQIQMQGQADMALEKMKLENALAIAEVQTKAQSIQERMAAVEDMMKQFHDQAHDLAMQKDQQQHQSSLAAQQAAHQQDAAAQQADATSQQSAQDAAQSQAAQEAQSQEQGQ
jgi:Phage P22-like portal protein